MEITIKIDLNAAKNAVDNISLLGADLYSKDIKDENTKILLGKVDIFIQNIWSKTLDELQKQRLK